MNSEASSQVAGWKRSRLTLATNATISTRMTRTGQEAVSPWVYQWRGRMDAGMHAPQGHCVLIMMGVCIFLWTYWGEVLINDTRVGNYLSPQCLCWKGSLYPTKWQKQTSPRKSHRLHTKLRLVWYVFQVKCSSCCNRISRGHLTDFSCWPFIKCHFSGSPVCHALVVGPRCYYGISCRSPRKMWCPQMTDNESKPLRNHVISCHFQLQAVERGF